MHVPGHLNPADLPTRDTATVADLQEGSIWLNGPEFLYTDRNQMPLSRTFLDQQFELPREELRAIREYY